MDPVLRWTHALLRAETAVAAVEALRGVRTPAAVEGLVELLSAPPSARAALAALAALAEHNQPLVVDALLAALDIPHSSVRLAAVETLHQRGVTRAVRPLARLL